MMRSKDLRRAVRRFSTYPREARRFVALACVGAPAVEASLALLGLRRTLGWIERLTSDRRPRGGAIGVHEGEQLVRRVYRYHFVRGECLPRSLLQYWIHRMDGQAVRFVVGVRQPRDGFDAHAWVEAENGENRPLSYAPLTNESIGP